MLYNPYFKIKLFHGSKLCVLCNIKQTEHILIVSGKLDSGKVGSKKIQNHTLQTNSRSLLQ